MVSSMENAWRKIQADKEMTMRKTQTMILAGTIILLLLGAGAELRPTCYAREESDVPTLNVGHVGHDHQIALAVAALKGRELEDLCGVWLKELKYREVYSLQRRDESVARLRLIKVQGGSGMPAAMERGELDIGCGGVAPVAFFVDRGNDFKILCPLNTDGDMLVMRKDFAAQNWEEFVAGAKSSDKPLVIGYKAPVAVAKLVFERGLIAEGISFNEGSDSEPGTLKVRMVNLHGQQNMLPSLSCGAVDGFVTNEPAASQAEVKGAGNVVCDLSALPPEGKWRKHPCCCLAARGDVMRKHPAIMVDLLKLILVSTRRINSDFEEAAKIASEWTKMPLEVELRSVPHITYIATPDDAWLKGMRVWIEMMQEMGTFEKRFAKDDPDSIIEKLCDLNYVKNAEESLNNLRVPVD